MNSSTASALKVAPRDVTRFDAVSESVQSWVLGEAIGADVCNAVFDAIADDPRPETVTAATAALPSRLRDDVIEYLASLRGARAENLLRVASSCGHEGRPREPSPVEQPALDAITRWFEAR